MAYFWVQQWVALPVITEEPMGDALGGTGLPPYQAIQGLPMPDEHISSRKLSSQLTTSDPHSLVTTNAPFYSQYSNLPSVATSRTSPTHYRIMQGQEQPPQSFNMSGMAGALPDYAAIPSGQQHPQQQNFQQPYQAQRALMGAQNPALRYQYPPSSQFQSQLPTQATAGALQSGYPQVAYGSNYVGGQGTSPGTYGQFGVNPPRTGGMAQAQQAMPNFAQTSQFYYNPTQPTPYAGGQMMFPGYQMGVGNIQAVQSSAGSYGLDATGLSVPTAAGTLGYGTPYGGVSFPQNISQGQVLRRQGSESSLGSVPRGPPRKPKQSGHALWVGNLPPGTTVTDLKDHFSREATKDIESLFLISKSNCAFVNYRSEAACAAAMQRFHDSRLHGVRLVCRLRRSSAPTPATPSGPSSSSAQRAPDRSPQQSPNIEQDAGEDAASEKPVASLFDGDRSQPPKVTDRYFVVKSLTLQDLELSVKNGIWATQAHNEQNLNLAYESAENVYLIFSANKSGEYFGYARMASRISEDASEIMKAIPKPDATEPTDAPRTIPTPATEWAPKGHIIDDSARGTIFWEADLSDSEDEAVRPAQEELESGEEQIWGKPFKVEWISTNRLPFYRTRGLRNPWNANREVKIARDGTELETSVGKRLVQMFHRLGPSSAAAPTYPGIPSGGPQPVN